MQNEEVSWGEMGEEGFLEQSHFQGSRKDCGWSEKRYPEEPYVPVEVGTNGEAQVAGD